VERVISRAVEVLGKSNSTNTEYQTIENDLTRLNGTVGLESVKAWKAELATRSGIKEAVLSKCIALPSIS